jgi:hypothetical protein
MPLRNAHAIAERCEIPHHDAQVTAVEIHLDPADEHDQA